MGDLITIGRFARITGLSVKALHMYDAMGLLRPIEIDRWSGYRYYSITQLTAARRIKLLRSIDMPLDAIQAIIEAPTPVAMDALLHEHQQRIAERILKDQQALRLLQRLIDHQVDDLAWNVQVKEVPDQLIASIRLQATPEEETGMIPSLIEELHAYATHHDVRQAHAPPLRITHEFSEELVDSEIAVPITRLSDGVGRITCRTLAGGSVAYVMHVGPHSDLWSVYWALLVWVQERGSNQHGPPREIYWMHPTDGQTAQYRTEVQWPIS